jgi:hypothetical protein
MSEYTPTFPELVAAARFRQQTWREFASTDEGYAILLMRLDAFWGHLRQRRSESIEGLDVLIELAATTQKLAEDRMKFFIANHDKLHPVIGPT